MRSEILRTREFLRSAVNRAPLVSVSVTWIDGDNCLITDNHRSAEYAGPDLPYSSNQSMEDTNIVDLNTVLDDVVNVDIESSGNEEFSVPINCPHKHVHHSHEMKSHEISEIPVHSVISTEESAWEIVP